MRARVSDTDRPVAVAEELTSDDPRATGLRKITHSATGLETWADDLEALRAELGIEKWAVFGHSVHAQIALAYASRYPERTSHLVLIGGVPYAGEG